MGETPGDWGFGEYITDNTAGGWYWQKNYTKNGQLVETPEEVYCPDVYHSFAAQLRGQKGSPREWIFVQLGRRWYVRDDGWKLNETGKLFDMKDSPFVEELVPADSKDEAAAAARKRLQAVLDKLNPAGGKTISDEDEAAAKDRAKKKAQRQKQGQKQGQRKTKTGQQPQPR